VKIFEAEDETSAEQQKNKDGSASIIISTSMQNVKATNIDFFG
jgi:hypothetical protein